MLKLQIFAKLSEAVSKETGIAVEDIASTDRREEVVDARYVLVYLLHLEGFYASMIAPLIGIKKRSVNRIISDFEHRLCVSPMMRIVFEHLKSSRGGIKCLITGQVLRQGHCDAWNIGGSFVVRLILTAT